MAGLIPAIHVSFALSIANAWMPDMRSGVTTEREIRHGRNFRNVARTGENQRAAPDANDTRLPRSTAQAGRLGGAAQDVRREIHPAPHDPGGARAEGALLHRRSPPSRARAARGRRR